MSYIVYERVKCDVCRGTGIIEGVTDGGSFRGSIGCYQPRCDNGYIDTPVNLLDVLKKARWDDIAFPFGEMKFENLRIED